MGLPGCTKGVVDPLGGVKSYGHCLGSPIRCCLACYTCLEYSHHNEIKMKNEIHLGNRYSCGMVINLYNMGAKLKLLSNDPQMEGFFYLANEYKAKS